MLPNIINVQKYAIHDGNGIRASVFFKGCPLRCAWCHNPESQSYRTEIMYNSEKCRCCLSCERSCPEVRIRSIDFSAGKPSLEIDRSNCIGCAMCGDACPYGAIEICGRAYEIDELAGTLMKDRVFYEISGGGVTLSGGEVMTADIDYIHELLKRLHMNGINTIIDTCGYTSYENFEKLLPYTDTFLYDIKHINTVKHLEHTGADNAVIFDNLVKLSHSGANIIIRVPVIMGFNAELSEMEEIINFLECVNIQSVDLLPYHNIAEEKYKRLGRSYINCYATPSIELMEEIYRRFKDRGYITRIGR